MAVVHAIIPHHRGREMLDECLETLLASTGVDLQIILVLNGCDEDLPEIVERESQIHTIEPESVLGFSGANNFGVAFAKENLGDCDYYYFLNNDTVSDSNALEKLVGSLESRPQAGIAGPMLLIQWAPEHLNSLGLKVTEDGWGWDHGIGREMARYSTLPDCEDVIAISGCALLISRRVFDRIHGWTDIYDYYFEDIDLCLKARQAGYEVILNSKAQVFHQVSATMTLDSDRKVFLFWRNRLILTMIHWPLRKLLPLVKPLIIDEVFSRPPSENQIQRRAAASAFKKLRSILRERWRRKSRYENWVPFLQPRGSVPDIILPEKRAEIEDEPAPTRTDRITSDSHPRRILILGVSPLPFENTNRSFGPGTRTWQITEPLIADGHTINLVAMRIPETYPADAPPEIVVNDDRFNYASIDQSVYFQTPYIKNVYQAFQPEAVIFAHGSASYDASVLDADVPVWIDLCGHVMAEAQAKAGVYKDDSYLDYFFQKMLPALFKGDAFSTVSDAQKWALIGELGCAGRLNSLTNGMDFVHTIPCGVEKEPYEQGPPVVRGIDIPKDAFIILWSGGFNTWTDVDTMFHGLVQAMDHDPSVYFVATGGQIDGHDERTYPRFVKLIENSHHSDRFILRGWIPREQVPTYYFEADVGINCEKDIYEVRLGSKHRILDWSRASLPVVTTRVTELSEALEEDEVGFVCSPGDPEALGKALIDAFEARDRLSEMGQRCRQSLRRRYGFAESTAGLREWALSPEFASDRDRSPLCLEALLNPDPGAPNHATVTDAIEISEGRFQWLLRVIARSYVVGGFSEIFRRGFGHFAGHRR